MSDKKFLFCLIYAALVVSILADAKNANLNYASFPANENGTCYKRVPYDEELALNISRGIIKTLPGSQQQQQQLGVKTGSNRGWLTILDCCEGFIRNKSTGNCETHCEEGCFGGTCTGPNVCTCEDGWQPVAGVCKPICRRGCADNAYCFSPDICTCKFGYEEEEGICKPVCRHGCKNGLCVAPRDCRCNPGYFLNETQKCEPICDGGCPHGLCVEPGVCECDNGYTNPEDSRGTCVPSCPDTCTSSNGQCYSPNVCTCNSGYTQTPSGTCIPECLGDCPNGRCVAPEECECDPGFIMNYELRGCVESSRGKGGYYENPAVNASHGNTYNNPTVPPERAYGGRGTYRPQDSSQIQGSNHGFKRPQSQQNYGNQQPGRAYGTQGVLNRHRPESEEDEEIYGNAEGHGVIGLNQTRNNSDANRLKGAAYPNRNYNHTLNPHENNYAYNGYRNNSTDRVIQPDASQGGPFAPLEPYHPDDRRPNQTNPRDRYPPYETHGNNPTSRPFRPVNQQGPFPNQGPYPSHRYNDTHDLRETNGTYYGSHRYNQTQRPYEDPYDGPKPYNGQRPHPTQETFSAQGPYSTPAPGQGLYPKLPPLPGQDPYSNQPPSYGQEPYSTQAPGQGLYPKLPHRPGQGPASPHDQHDFENPYRPHHNEPRPNPSNEPNKPPAFGVPAYGHPGNSHDTQGVKGSHPRPRPDSSRNPGLELAYGANEMQNLPQNGNLNPRPGQASAIDGLYDPYNPPGSDGPIYILDLANGQIFDPFLPPGSIPQIDPGFAPFRYPGVPTCNSPCINSICLGNNVCQCKPGYEPDPRNPNGFTCLPSCPGGCANGVCSGPNLCICNVGFIKEHGVKGVQRCVPTN